MKNLSLIVLLSLVSLPGFAALLGKCTPGSVGTGFSGTTTFCQGAAATALTYNYAECNMGSGATTTISCSATWYYNTSNTTTINGNTVTVSGPTVFTSAAGVNGNLPTVTPITTTAGTYYYFCVVTWATAGTCTGPFVTGTQAITINPLPSAINGATSVCVGSSITLTDNNAGGTWTSSVAGQASIGSTTGILTGVAGLSVPVITYKLATGCQITKSITVNPLPAAITGTTTVCMGLTTTLADVTAGGTWASSNTGVATIVNTTHIATGVTAGTTTITYALPTGCISTTNITVNQTPTAINGTFAGCVGTTTTLSDNLAGGTWTTSSGTVASVGSASGIVSFAAVGNATIAYTMSTGCKATVLVTTNPLPGIVAGTTTVCAGLTTSVSDATAGGTWSSSNTSIATIGTAHIVTGIAAGTATITYALPTGCFKTATITVNQTPTAVNGTFAGCIGTTTTLSDNLAGGTWSTSNAALATIGSATGLVTFVAAGNPILAYTMPVTGCKITVTATTNVLPAVITGATSVCPGLTTNITDATAGGSWGTANALIATVGSTGIVSGIAAGSTTITYTLPTGCFKTYNETVNPLPENITGTKTVCQAATTTLSDATTPVTSWTSSNAAVATVVANTGVVTGVAGGTTTITYKIATGCYTTATVTVTPTPAAITGASVMCSNASITLSDAATGGAWTSSNTSIAVIDISTGNVYGVSGGNVTMSYSTGCGVAATKAVTVNQAPAAIGGSNNVCTGLTTSLNNTVLGGTWTSNNTSSATINSASGVLTGIAAGTATISYIMPTGCFVTGNETVNGLPQAVSVGGGGTYCNNTTLIAGNHADGTMYFENVANNGTSTLIPSSSQVISTSGTYYFRALSSAGCWSNQGSASVTIAPLPAITNTLTLCPGSTGTLDNTTTGGTWTSSNPAIATIGLNNGIVTAIATGSASITYAITGCTTTTTITVNPLPTVSIGSMAPITKGAVSTRLRFSTTGGPTHYNLAWCGSAHTAGFSDVNAGRLDTLAQDTILHIAVPTGATAAMYTGTLSVTTAGCISRGSTIRAIVSDSLNIFTFAGTGANGYSGDGGAGSVSTLSHASSVASDCDGNTYIADYDNAVVRKVDARGVITTFAGNGSVGYSGDGGPATSAELSNPTGLVIDALGNVYISDYNNMVVRKVTPSGIITTFAGSGAIGYSGDGGPATSAKLAYPVGLAVDIENNIYITDYLNSAIRKVNTSGIITTVAGNGTAGYDGDNGYATDATLGHPRSVAVDGTGNIFIADYDNDVIREVNTSGIISTIAGIGLAGYAGDGNEATLAQLNNPWGIAVDGYGGVYFSELHNNVIRKIDTNGIITTIAGNGTPGFTNASLANNAQLNQPMGIAINCSGNLYIADNANYAVRILGQYNRVPYFTGGTNQNLNVGQNNPVASLNSLLTVNDFDTAQSISVTIKTNAANGTLAAAYSATSTGSSLVPTGLTYIPTPGFTGDDEFTIQVSDGIAITTTTIHVTVTLTGARMSNTTAVNNTVENNISLQVSPNPSRGDLNIKTSGAGTFYLFSMEGKVVGEYVVTDQQTQINMPGGLPSGIYIGRFVNTDGNTKEVKLVFEQ